MCGRYTIVDIRAMRELFEDVLGVGEGWEDVVPRWNVAPTQGVAVVLNEEPKRVQSVAWGLVPFWAKDPKIGSTMINARAESIGVKAGFREAFRKRRCLIAADGFYEWKKIGEGKGTRKLPVWVRVKGGRPFAFAGLWERWKDDEGKVLKTCTVITTRANEFMRPIHDRMPVILKPGDFGRWLEKGGEELLVPYEGELEGRGVSRFVNSPRNEGEGCVAAVEGEGEER